MKRNPVNIPRLLAAALLLSATATAADPRSGWIRLEKLQPGDKVRVVVRSQQPVTVTFGAVLEDRLQLVGRKNEQIEFKQAEIREVDRLLHRSRARAAAPWIGAAAGFGGGFAAGWAASCGKGEWFCIGPTKPVGGLLVGLAFAGVGATVGHFSAGKGKKVIYRAR